MSELTGTGTLLRLAWRRDRVLIPVSLLALTALSVGSGQATLALYPDEASARNGLGSVLANVLLWTGTIYPDYARGAAIWDITPETDQKIGAGIMMVEGSILTLCLFAWLFIRAGREGEERQALLDQVSRAFAVGVASTPTFIVNGQIMGFGPEGTFTIESIKTAIGAPPAKKAAGK